MCLQHCRSAAKLAQRSQCCKACPHITHADMYVYLSHIDVQHYMLVCMQAYVQQGNSEEKVKPSKAKPSKPNQVDNSEEKV